MTSDDDSFSTVKGTEGCKSCKKTVAGDTIGVHFMLCYRCKGEIHLSCLGICASGKEPTRPMAALIARKNTLFACDDCVDADCTDALDCDEPDANNIKSLATDVKALKEGLTSVLAMFGASKEAPQATKAARKSAHSAYASIAAKHAPASGLVQAMSAAVRDTNSEELRLRSLVIDGVPSVEGECDREKVDAFIAYLGHANAIRVSDVYRMGKSSPLGRPPKIKVVLATATMQRLLLERQVRELISSPDCPSAFKNAFLNPSRSWEERRLLMKLRKRRNELNEEVKDSGDSWFLDYRRGVLVKRVGGEPEWKGPGDVGWEGWESEWERSNPPTRGRPESGDTPPTPPNRTKTAATGRNSFANNARRNAPSTDPSSSKAKGN